MHLRPLMGLGHLWGIPPHFPSPLEGEGKGGG